MKTDKLADVIREAHGKIGPFDKFEYAASWVRERFVVIDRDDLPKVEEDDGETVRIGPHGNWFARGLNAESLRRHAYRLLVAADWADANPPVDEKAVKELTDAMGVLAASKEDWNRPLLARDLARRLVADGWKREVTP